jgi:hypothetical protein
MEMEKGRLLTLAELSSGALTRNTNDGCDPRIATRLATQLFGFYRASTANDPEMFIAGAAKVLAQFPEPIVRLICDPVSGLPWTNEWLPNLAEIRVACEKLMAPVKAERKRQELREHTARVLAPLPPATAENRRNVREMADDLRAELNARGGPRKIDFRKPGDAREAEAVRRHFEARLADIKASADKPLADPRQRCNDDKIATGEHSRDEIAGDNF